MNIMLVSVTERTREIGLRMAIGARGRDVLLQFLVEAVVLCVVGGAFGIALGLLVARGVTLWMTWPTAVSPASVAIAFAFPDSPASSSASTRRAKQPRSIPSMRCGSSSPDPLSGIHLL